MDHPRWIWQHPTWHSFDWQAERLAPLLRECAQAQGRLLGMSGVVDQELSVQSELDALLQNILTSSAIVESSRHLPGLDPLLRAGVAHFWFVTLHPFDDGNGRLARAITDLALAQAEHQAIRFYAMSSSILKDRAGYYRILENSQRGGTDISAWLEWFLQTLLSSLQQAMSRIDRVLDKTRFWQQHRQQALSAQQIKVLNRLFDGDQDSFAHGISASQYQALAKVSKATATRHLADLLAKGCIIRLPGGGRSTRYAANLPKRLGAPGKTP